MKLSYQIPDIPPSNNKFIGRENRWEYQKIKKQWAEYILILCRPKPKEPLNHVVVTLIYHFSDKHRRDPDNYSGKMILDGLTNAEIIKDDSFFCIDLRIRAVYDGKGFTEIIIESEEK